MLRNPLKTKENKGFVFATFYKSQQFLTLSLLILGNLWSVKVFGQDTLNKANNIEIKDTISKNKNKYLKDERLPNFPGGNEEMYKFISKNLKLPSSSSNVKGKVLVSFMVNKDGKISKLRIIKGISEEINLEVARVIYSMPKWIPAKINNSPASVKFYILITFKS